MKTSRLFAILSLLITVPGAWISSTQVAQAKAIVPCPPIPLWHPTPLVDCSTVNTKQDNWCAGAYVGGCCMYMKIKSYCVSDDPAKNGALVTINYVLIHFYPNTVCQTSLDGTGECSVPTVIAP